MKLSLKINYILLPVMVVIFSIAGVFSYTSQKMQLNSSLSEQLQSELTHISHDLNEALRELDFAIRMSLENYYIQKYLIEIYDDTAQYYTEKELAGYINQLKLNHGMIESFALVDINGEELIYFNTSDPFAKYSADTVVTDHLAAIQQALDLKGVARVNASTYKLNDGVEGPEFLVVKTFTPEQSFTVPTFSYGQTLLTAVVRSKIRHYNEFQESVKSKLDPGAQLILRPNTTSHSLGNEEQIKDITLPDYELGFQLIHDLWSIKICLSQIHLNELYKPFQLLYAVIVLSVTAITFLLLKWLIVKQIIKPVERLTKKVESVNHDDLVYIERSKSNDEVSILTNKYINLITDLDDLAKRDSLTGLPNRKKFNLDITRIMNNCTETDTKCAVIYFDIDNFKYVNDKYGHHVGDHLFVVFAERLVESFVDFEWESLTISEFEFARLSGDEFAIIVGGLDGLDILTEFSHRILSLFEDGFEVDGTQFDIGVSVGISVYPDDAKSVTELVNNADSAMYACKNVAGRNHYQFYSKEMDREIKRQTQINEDLKDAIKSNEFYLTYMPVYDIEKGKIKGAEVLIRTSHESLISYGPADFIPVAESSGLIKHIDYWVFENALQKLSVWIEELNFDGTLAINFSSWQLSNSDFVNVLSGLLTRYEIPAHMVEMEITETCFIPGDEQNIERLKALKELGVKVSLDDFGTGYTAFSQLINYPIDTLKIDRMFVNAIDSESTDKQLIEVIIEMAKIYDLNIIAEGVETVSQLDYVRNKGCQEVQGFLLSKPLKEDDFIAAWKRGSLPEYS
ncbi:putative bifunctional diguanylate cyclase/phosphodiesterase [Vibrio crassostreae]|uniref:putative bifunctional diguanylate cyclase/phosphodiesterase n=1 Tax=Vibrio crassostreae TaxID=246167 RepID=UPI00352FE73A